MGLRLLLFPVLVAGAIVWGIRQGREIDSALSSLRLFGTTGDGIAGDAGAGTGPGWAGEQVFAGITDYLARPTVRPAPVLVVGGDRDEAAWIAYLSYPRHVRAIAFSRVEYAFGHLASGHYTLIVIPPAGAPAADATAGPELLPFPFAFRKSLLARIPFTSMRAGHKDPSGIVIFEAEL